MITCTRESAYRAALTRGKQYELLAEKDSKVRVRGDNGRTRWYSSFCFDMEGNPAPRLFRWKFDDPSDELPEMSIFMTMQFDDGKYRWLILETPASLKNLLEDRDMEPGLWTPHMIVVRSFDLSDVGLVLSQLDRAGDLMSASRSIDYDEESGHDHDEVAYDWHQAITTAQYRNEVPYRKDE